MTDSTRCTSRKLQKPSTGTARQLIAMLERHAQVVTNWPNERETIHQTAKELCDRGQCNAARHSAWTNHAQSSSDPRSKVDFMECESSLRRASRRKGNRSEASGSASWIPSRHKAWHLTVARRRWRNSSVLPYRTRPLELEAPPRATILDLFHASELSSCSFIMVAK